MVTMDRFSIETNTMYSLRETESFRILDNGQEKTPN